MFEFINFYCNLVLMKIKINPKTLYWVCIYSPSNVSFIDFNSVCSLVLITSCNVSLVICLFYNPLLLLMVTHYAKIFYLVPFLGCLLIHVCAFYILGHICLWWLVNFYDLIFLPYAFHLTITYQYHLLLILCHCFLFICFFANINHLIHKHEKKNFSDDIIYSIIFNCLSLNFLF